MGTDEKSRILLWTTTACAVVFVVILWHPTTKESAPISTTNEQSNVTAAHRNREVTFARLTQPTDQSTSEMFNQHYITIEPNRTKFEKLIESNLSGDSGESDVTTDTREIIGVPLDPEDISSMQDDDTVLESYGETLDPDDILSMQDDDTAVETYGETLDPDDILSMQDDDNAVETYGETLDPNDILSSQANDTAVEFYGETLNPDDILSMQDDES